MKIRTVCCRLILLLFAAVTFGCPGPGGGPIDQPPPSALSQNTPAEADALWRRAEQAQKEGNSANAISLYERLVQTYPNNVIAAKSLYAAGKIHLTQGQPERALQFFDYLVYTYSGWDGIVQAKVDRLQALMMTNKKKQAAREALPLWDASASQPAVRVRLAGMMAGYYAAEDDLDTAFDWLIGGFSVSTTPEEKRGLTQVTLETLKKTKESEVRKLYKKNPSDFMKVFLDYRMIQIDMEKAGPEAAQAQLRDLIAKNPGHPLASEIHATARGTRAEPQAAFKADRIGVLVPLNGAFAKYGDMVLKGLACAVADWNETHPGQNVNLVVKDAQADATVAAASFEELVRKDAVLAVIGPLGGQASKTVVPLADKLGVPLLPLTQKEEETLDSPYVVYMFLDNRQLVRTLVQYCRDKLGYSRFATLYPDDRYGQKLSKTFSEVVKELGGEVLASVPYKEKSTDFKEPVQKLVNIAKKNTSAGAREVAPFEALFVPDQVQTVSLLAPQLPYNNVVGATLLGTNLWSEAPLAQTGGVYVENALFATSFYADSRAPQVKKFREKFEAKYEMTPSYLEAQAYDALMMVLQARSALGAAVDRGALVQNILRTQRYQGVAGVYSFRPTGELDRSYVLMQIVNGQPVQVGQ